MNVVSKRNAEENEQQLQGEKYNPAPYIQVYHESKKVHAQCRHKTIHSLSHTLSLSLLSLSLSLIKKNREKCRTDFFGVFGRWPAGRTVVVVKLFVANSTTFSLVGKNERWIC